MPDWCDLHFLSCFLIQADSRSTCESFALPTWRGIQQEANIFLQLAAKHVAKSAALCVSAPLEFSIKEPKMGALILCLVRDGTRGESEKTSAFGAGGVTAQTSSRCQGKMRQSIAIIPKAATARVVNVKGGIADCDDNGTFRATRLQCFP